MKKIISLVVFFAVLISCGKEIPSVQTDVTAPESTEEVKVRTVYLDAEVTRTQIVAGENVHWSPGDVLDVYVNHAYNRNTQTYGMQKTFSNLSDEVSASTVFKCSDWPETISDYMSNGFAFYPAGLVEYGLRRDAGALDKSFDPGIYFTLPESQEAVDGSFDPAANLSYAIFNTNDVAEGKANLMFTNMCSLVKITLPSSSDDVKSIQISSPNQLKLAGKIQLYASGALNGSYYYYNNLSYSNSQIPSYSDVTLSKQSGECLTAGETYYAVILSSGNFVSGSKIHDKFDFIFTNKDGYTIKKTLNLQASGGWSPKPSQFISINVSSLPFAAAPFLDVTTTSITASAKGSTESFSVNANNDVTVTIPGNVGWITGSYSNSQCILEIKPNKESGSRSATITISSGGLSRNVTITQPNITYSRTGSALVRASYFENGKKYVATRNSNRDQYWYNDNGNLVVSTYTNSAALPAGCVFVFEQDNSKYNGPSYGWGSGYKYSYMSAGAWKSAYSDQYLNHSFYFGSTPYYFTVLSGWHSGSTGYVNGEDFDIYKSNTENELMDCQYSFKWGNTGNYKWSFYEVVEN